MDLTHWEVVDPLTGLGRSTVSFFEAEFLAATCRQNVSKRRNHNNVYIGCPSHWAEGGELPLRLARCPKKDI